MQRRRELQTSGPSQSLKRRQGAEVKEVERGMAPVRYRRGLKFALAPPEDFDMEQAWMARMARSFQVPSTA